MLRTASKLLALERKLFGLALSQPDRPAGRAAAAGLELRTRDVDADDSPVGRKPVEIDAVADSHVEQIEIRCLGEVPQDFVAGAVLAAVAEPGEMLPEPELGPEWAIVKLLGDLVVVAGFASGDQDVVFDRQPRGALRTNQGGSRTDRIARLPRHFKQRQTSS